MGKFYLAVATSAGLLFALAASAEAGGGHGRTPGAAFTPPGWTNNTVGQQHSGTGGTWSSNSATGVQPPGWSHNTTGQANGWNATLGGGVPPGLKSH